MIKLVATDIDGTLLIPEGQFTEGVKKCVQKLCQKGIEAEKISDNQYEVSIKMDLFNNAKGKYYIDVRAVEFTDVEYVIGSTECKVE